VLLPIELTCGFLLWSWVDWVKDERWEIINSSGVLDFVDFLRKCQQPTEQHSPAEEEAYLSAPTATELHQSGVKFKRPEKSSLLDIRFSNGILEIPQLKKLYDQTEILFRNLHAFEQCYYRFEDPFVSDNINTFISCLVSGPNNVEVLARNENLKILLNSDEAVLSNLLHNLQKENVVNTYGFLWGVWEELNSHCRKTRHKWKATLK